jgi:hypothetical protein
LSHVPGPQRRWHPQQRPAPRPRSMASGLIAQLRDWRTNSRSPGLTVTTAANGADLVTLGRAGFRSRFGRPCPHGAQGVRNVGASLFYEGSRSSSLLTPQSGRRGGAPRRWFEWSVRDCFQGSPSEFPRAVGRGIRGGGPGLGCRPCGWWRPSDRATRTEAPRTCATCRAGPGSPPP